jgi:cytochrome bd-type quinol oxidase subunit 2
VPLAGVARAPRALQVCNVRAPGVSRAARAVPLACLAHALQSTRSIHGLHATEKEEAMSIRRILLGLAFFAFVAEAAAVTWMVGIGGTIDAMFANPVTRFMTAELTLCLVMLCVWMWRDARQRGINAVPYVVATALLGGGGPLLYFVLHPQARAESGEVAHVHASQPA